MNIISAVRDYLGQIEQRRRFYRTERLIRGLPPEVLKDIGWPGAAEGVENETSARHSGLH